MSVILLSKPGPSLDLGIKFQHSYGNSKTLFSFNRFANSFILPLLLLPKKSSTSDFVCFLNCETTVPFSAGVLNWTVASEPSRTELPCSLLPGGIVQVKPSTKTWMNADVPVTSCFHLSCYCLAFNLTFSFSLNFVEFLEMTSVVKSEVFIHLTTPPQTQKI